MRVCGVIAEFDPFHGGHRYHLDLAREKTKADFMVCILGCAFSQRGDAMLLSTHQRAKMALLNGYDLVLGMPVTFSCAQANRFARGGVETLHRLGVVTHLAFGCETTEKSQLTSVAMLLNHPDAAYLGILKQGIAAGHSFAKAQSLAIQDSLPGISADLLAAPNFILGIAYIRELQRLGSPIVPLPILRTTGYHSQQSGPLASASRVRRMIKEGDTAAILEACPQESSDVLFALMAKKLLHDSDALDRVLLARLYALSPEASRLSPEISEGLEQRILHAARQADSREKLINLVKTRRYPRSRINRALTHLLLGLDAFPASPGYARLLGFKKSAGPLLQRIGLSGFPLVDKPRRSQQPGILQDLAAEELWHLGAGQRASLAWQQQVLVLP